jgi:hypothetical protein
LTYFDKIFLVKKEKKLTNSKIGIYFAVNKKVDWFGFACAKKNKTAKCKIQIQKLRSKQLHLLNIDFLVYISKQIEPFHTNILFFPQLLYLSLFCLISLSQNIVVFLK